MFSSLNSTQSCLKIIDTFQWQIQKDQGDEERANWEEEKWRDKEREKERKREERDRRDW